jgi:hypothetical protein
MRCLYCGKQLALLKRLTGGGEFCSDAHKQSYQEEYNRLALSRLLQAQSKPGEIKISAPKAPAPSEGLGQPLPPGAARRRALPASAPTPEPAARAPQRTERVFYAPAATAETVPEAVEETPVTVQPAIQETVEETVEETIQETFEEAVEETFEETPQHEVSEEAPPEVTVFSMEIPAYSALADGIPYVEPWLDMVAAPTSPAWQAAYPSTNLPLATLQAVAGPPPGEIEVRALAVEAASLEFAHAGVSLTALSERSFATVATAHILAEAENEQLFSSLPSGELVPLGICSSVGGAPLAGMNLTAEPAEFANRKANLHVPFEAAVTPARMFPAASPIHLDIRVSASGASHQTSSNGALRFPVRITFQDSALLNLYPSGIDFPAEDSEVVLIAPWADQMLTHSNGFNAVEEDALDETEPPGSPREVLEALSKLHQDMAAQQEETVEPQAEPVATDLELVSEPVEQNSIAAPPEEPSAATIDISAEPADEHPIPRSAHDLFEIPLKTFAPLKPALAVESNALVRVSPELPRLKALPLRPKVAKAPPGFSPQPGVVQSKGPAVETKSKAPTPAPAASPAAPPRPEVRTSQIPAPAVKQPAPPVKPPPTVQPVKPGQPSKPAQPVKPVAPTKPSQAAKPAQPPVKTAKAPTASGPAAPKQSPSPTPAATPPAQPVAHDTKAAAQTPAAPSVPEQSAEPAEETMPSFASIQPGKNGSFLGSLKGKLILAILLVVTASGVFYNLGNRTHAPATTPAATTTTDDAAGPSIMMGEGGWVQSWGGDTNGSHAGRQITIYRPSLKLSDYRIEFQGEIDSKSIGWVFRAMDPYNYYAMKLAIVTPGLSPKMALIKYVVMQGHETEVGRVPLDIAARNDTLFTVRMDVRGSKFSTFVQGQQVDVWTDEQIKSGGVGFLNERAERARVKSAAISYLTGGKN